MARDDPPPAETYAGYDAFLQHRVDGQTADVQVIRDLINGDAACRGELSWAVGIRVRGHRLLQISTFRLIDVFTVHYLDQGRPAFAMSSTQKRNLSEA